MQCRIDANKFNQFKNEIHERLPHLVGKVQIQTNGSVAMVAAVRGNKLAADEIVTITAIAQKYTAVEAAPVIPSWQPVRRSPPRYAGQVKAAGRLRMR